MGEGVREGCEGECHCKGEVVRGGCEGEGVRGGCEREREREKRGA